MFWIVVDWSQHSQPEGKFHITPFAADRGSLRLYVHLWRGGAATLGWKMKAKHLFIPQSSRRFAIVLALLLGLLVVVPALADYIGPDRTETVYVNRRKRCHYVAVHDPAGPGYDSCTLNLYVPPNDGCPSNVSGYFSNNPHSCGSGWPSDWPSCCNDPGTSCSINSSSAAS